MNNLLSKVMNLINIIYIKKKFNKPSFFFNYFNHTSSLGLKSPSHRYDLLKSGDLWLAEKRSTDGAEGLWRIHDNLYDFREFSKAHPGGKFWLEVTKGTDITEAFESHHISERPEKLLKKFFVRKSRTPRSSPYTFEEHGFYRTLKGNVREQLKTVPKDAGKASDITIDLLMVSTFFFAILGSKFGSYPFVVASGTVFGLTLIAAHNYVHRKDNFRMYYVDVCMMQSREWRILHVLSHHLFTNTVLDAQAYFSEPFILFYPQKKPWFVRYGAWIYTPFLLWPNFFHVAWLLRMSQFVVHGRTKHLSLADFLPLTLPTSMYLFSSQQSILLVIATWMMIEMIGSFVFCLLSYTTGHFHPDIFIDGDIPRLSGERDWGVLQLDSVSDRREVTGNKFLVLVSFGDHALHHLFPTLDHAVLNHLYPTVEATMKQFNVDIWMTSQRDMFFGYFRQLARERPNNYERGTASK